MFHNLKKLIKYKKYIYTTTSSILGVYSVPVIYDRYISLEQFIINNCFSCIILHI